jgi:phage-related minor tail protein
MANRILEPAPRDEGRLIRDALRSGMFPQRAASTRAALVKHAELMEANANLRAVQDRRRSMEEAKRTQMDYDRQMSEMTQRRIAPLQTFNHQMNDRRRVANEIFPN